jgi:hypothetical protein
MICPESGFGSFPPPVPVLTVTVTPPAVAVAPTNQPTPPGAENLAFAKLPGKWLRPDGGYILDIRNDQRLQSRGLAGPREHRACDQLCWGECPKNRLVRTPSGEVGLNYLCPGLKKFYDHIQRDMPAILR